MLTYAYNVTELQARLYFLIKFHSQPLYLKAEISEDYFKTLPKKYKLFAWLATLGVSEKVCVSCNLYELPKKAFLWSVHFPHFCLPE